MVIKTSVVRGQVGTTTLYGEPIPGRMMLRETRTDIQIYVHPMSMKHGKPPPRATGEELCKCCGINDERMKRLLVEVLLEEDSQEIEDMLAKHRVGGYDANDLEAVPIQVTAQNRASSANFIEKSPLSVEACRDARPSMAKSSKQTPGSDVESLAEPVVLDEIVNQSRPSKMSLQGYSSSASALEIKARDIHQAARHAQLGASVRIGGYENVPPQNHTTAEGAYLTKKIKPSKAVKPSTRPTQKSSLHKAAGNRPLVMMSNRDQSREEGIGICGEQAVFSILKDVFGTAIDEAVWTSELRHHVDGYKRWVPEDQTTLYSDFTVSDEHGTLTSWMIENDVSVPNDWLGAKLRYHIEVKSTAKTIDDPFFMSHLQINKARDLAEKRRSSNDDDKDVFVIFRVYDVDGPEPGLEVYCNPWKMIKEGMLNCETQEWRVTPV
jgi:hypothetical protein